MNKISFVLPLKINAHDLGTDLERVKRILLPSFIKFFNLDQISQFLIIVPADEEKEVSEQLKGFKEKLKLSVISEEEVLAVIPGWNKHSNMHKALRSLKVIDNKIFKGRVFRYLKLQNGWHNLGGWLRQQMLKMFASKLIDTDHYMTLDSDLCLIHTADLEAFFSDKKAVVGLDTVNSKYDWWVGSAEVLDIKFKLNRRDPVISVTPQILSTQIVVHLVDHLILKSREKGFLTIFEYMSTNRSWTEYTLYWLFMLEFYKREDHYTAREQACRLQSKYCVWYKDEAPNKEKLRERIDSAFRDNNAFFLVVQSNSIPFADYYEAIKGHLL